MVGSASLLDVVAERLDSAAATAATATAGELREQREQSRTCASTLLAAGSALLGCCSAIFAVPWVRIFLM